MRKGILVILFIWLQWSEVGYLFGLNYSAILHRTRHFPHKTTYPINLLVESLADYEMPFADWEKNESLMAFVNQKMDSLSLDEKIAQCYMLACYTDGASKNMDYVERMVREGKCGGILFFKGNPTAQAYWTDRLQKQAKTQLLVAIDGEWGLAMRLDSTTTFPRQLTLGAISDSRIIYDMGREIGRQCRTVGVNVNFAPVADVNNNPRNPVIGDRSFGEDKMRVALKSLEYAAGMQSEKVLACAKHFPGHGDTDKDSHHSIPVIQKSISQMDVLELFPFKVLFTNGIGSTMSAHLSLPQIDKSGIPGSLSKEVTTILLKENMNFKGLVFTDALNMKGASTAVPGRNVDSLAFVAGNDVLEYSENPEKGQSRIKKAIQSGDIPISVLDEKVKKILAYKYLLGLEEYHPLSTQDLTEKINSGYSKQLVQQLYEKAITFAAADSGVLPISNYFRSMASVAINSKKETDFQQHISSYFETQNYIFDTANEALFNQYKASILNHDLVIFELHGMVRSASKRYGVSQASVDFIKEIAKQTQVILVIYGSPYSLKYFDDIKNIVVAYEDNPNTQLAAANAILGGISVTGRLPVSASDKFKVGIGVASDQILRMRIGSPEDAGLKTEDLREIDEIVLNGLIANAYPGCQVAIVKDNQLVWNKSYGTLKYEENTKVKTTDLYDVASITKTAATTIAIMKLYDDGKIDLSKTVGDYVTLPKGNTVSQIKLSDILTHHAGLKSYLNFYTATIDSNFQTFYSNKSVHPFTIQVAEDLYIRNDYPDTIWQIITTYPIASNPNFVYSDFDFYILQRIVEEQTGKKLDEYLNEVFYKPMGLHRTLYNPKSRFGLNKIVPSEKDDAFRKQIIRGFVHDPGAAMIGGVAGHAGLFSNALDLAQIMQMLLNKGFYNGQKFLKEETIDLFTAQYNPRSRRGLGFDKPETDKNKKSPCYEGTHPSTFGHTGFTGTAVWSDPNSNTTLVFLSNRIYPNANNQKLINMGIRTDIQRVLYNALKNQHKQ